ncbi:DUF3592 domain-containing protein [Streptomyces sp. NPDC004629]|uniref:DUF3592 domain-containing protein n=1 Tax=Streptomyces sp. NPDC004629 TaxID=3364705 RepID=UPI00367E3E71
MKVQAGGLGARRWIVWGAIAFGALFLGIGLVLTGVSVSFLASAERTRGTVVGMEWRYDQRNDRGGVSRTRRVHDEPVAYPVVEFTSADGIRRTFRSDTGANPPAYEEGAGVEVRYRADSPEDARINGFASLWLLPLVFGGIGLVIAGIGTGVALATRGRSRSVSGRR